MITKQDLLEAIAECQGARNPNATTAIRLAAFYTILDHLEEKPEPVPTYSYASPADGVIDYKNGVIEYKGESEFAREVNGKPQKEVMKVFEELMETIRVLNERLYNGVMRKLTSI